MNRSVRGGEWLIAAGVIQIKKTVVRVAAQAPGRLAMNSARRGAG